MKLLLLLALVASPIVACSQSVPADSPCSEDRTDRGEAALTIVADFFASLTAGDLDGSRALVSGDGDVSFSPDIVHETEDLVRLAGSEERSALESDWTFDGGGIGDAARDLNGFSFAFFRSEIDVGGVAEHSDGRRTYGPGEFVWRVAADELEASITEVQGNGKIAIDCETNQIQRVLLSGVCLVNRDGVGIDLAPWVGHDCPGEITRPRWQPVAAERSTS